MFFKSIKLPNQNIVGVSGPWLKGPQVLHCDPHTLSFQHQSLTALLSWSGAILASQASKHPGSKLHSSLPLVLLLPLFEMPFYFCLSGEDQLVVPPSPWPLTGRNYPFLHDPKVIKSKNHILFISEVPGIDGGSGM